MAIGDSFTEGLDDPYPSGGFRGWADLVAGRLAVRDPGFRYANLAVRGRLLPQIIAEQVPPVEELRPALITIAGGGNDVLRRKVDLLALERLFDDAVGRLRGTGAEVVCFTAFDLSRRIPALRRLRPRMEIMNGIAERVTQRHGAHLIDMWNDRTLDDPRLWSDDRLHLSSGGHRRMAAKVLTALGLPAEEAWTAPLPAVPPSPWGQARLDDLRWVRRHLAPWVRRRLAGESSGDLVDPKRPELAPVDPAAI